MGWFILAQLFSTLISMVRLGRKSDNEKDLEIVILRYQLDILQWKRKRLLRPERAEKLILAVLTSWLKKAGNRPDRQMRHVVRILQPETVLRWQREPVERWRSCHPGALRKSGWEIASR